MSMPKPQSIYTVEEYLTLERASEERHEFVDGYIFAMAGESGEHGDISVNIVALVANQLRGTPCRARNQRHQSPQRPDTEIAKWHQRIVLLSRCRRDLR